MTEPLVLDRDELLRKLIANKAVRGYQLEFTTVSGNSYFGFVTGLDEDMIQILTTPFGLERGNSKHPYGKYNLAASDGSGDTDYYQWISITNIESISENRLSLNHFVSDSKNKIARSQKKFVQTCESFLKNSERQ